jgi:hypothetical protein
VFHGCKTAKVCFDNAADLSIFAASFLIATATSDRQLKYGHLQ